MRAANCNAPPNVKRAARVAPETARGTALDTPNNNPFADRRKFLIWACMAGFIGPERVVERILADLAFDGVTS